MKRSLLVSTVLFLSYAGVAQAKPVAGTHELRLNQGFVPGFATSGVNLFYASSNGVTSSENLTLMSAGAGLGYFISDKMEVGANLNLLIIDVGGASARSPGIQPFVRGYAWSQGGLGLYAEARLTLQPFFTDGDSTMLYGAGADVGVERFFTDSWALRVGIGYAFLRSSDGDGTIHVPGINWAIAAYF